MNIIKNWNVFMLLVAMAGVGWIVASAELSPSSSAIPASPRAGFAAPDFTLSTLDGQTVTLSDYRGQIVMVNMWATWCPPCRAEMPAMQEIYEQNKDKGFVVLAINATDQDDRKQVAAFVDEHQFTFPILMDEFGEVGQDYLVRSFPTTFFIDRDGIITSVVPGGPMKESTIQSKIDELPDK